VDGRRQEAPHLLEEFYNLEDALLVGGLLNTLIRRSDRVRVACLAQLVKAIAPLMTNEDGLLRQTIYYPYAWALEYARGNALNLAAEGPSYEVARLSRSIEAGDRIIPDFGQVPFLDVTATLDDASKTATLFVLNRDLVNARELEVSWQDAAPNKVNSCRVLTGKDLNATNTFAAPKQVTPQTLEAPQGRVEDASPTSCALLYAPQPFACVTGGQKVDQIAARGSESSANAVPEGPAGLGSGGLNCILFSKLLSALKLAFEHRAGLAPASSDSGYMVTRL
jgi:alpha-L-arabinofuranosidase